MKSRLEIKHKKQTNKKILFICLLDQQISVLGVH